MSQQFVNAYKVFQKMKWTGMIISGIVVFIMMLYTTLDVALRNFVGSSPLYAYEVSTNYFMPMTVFPALAYAFGVGMLPRIEFIVVKVNEKYQRTVAIFLIIVEIVLMILLTIFGLQYLISAVETGQAFTAGGSNYSLAPVILFVPIGFLLVVVEMVFLLVKNIKSEKPSFIVLDKK